jgi:hypothetical protein
MRVQRLAPISSNLRWCQHIVANLSQRRALRRAHMTS